MTKYFLPSPSPLRHPYSPFRNFNYMHPVHIKGTNKDLRDYQVRIVLNRNNFPLEKCKSDGGDIRFRDETGQSLPFWIESWSANEAVIWCKVPHIPANRTKEIWIVYGNPAAISASDGSATFDFFDDFTESHIYVNYFASNGIHQATYDIIGPAGTHYNSKTFIAWQGANLNPYAIEYNHLTQSWSQQYKVGENPLGNDEHGCPAILRDASGYLHVFYGSHGNSACSGDACYTQHAKSSNPDDITSWVDKGNIGPKYGTYSKPVLVGSDIYLFIRRGVGGSTYEVETYIKSEDNGETWSSYNDIIDFGSYRSIYTGKVEVEGTSKIHISWCDYDHAEDKRLNAYHAYLDLSDMHMKSMDGTDLGSVIDKSDADAHCLVFDSGTSFTNFPKVHLDANGTPYIIFLHDDNGWKFKFTKWNGSSWDSPTTITSSDYWINCFDFIVHSSSNIEAYLTTSGLTGWGGDIEKWTWDGTSWSKVATIISESANGRALNYPVVVHNFDSELKIVFTEVKDDWTTSLKVFAYGDNGFVQSSHSGLDPNKWEVLSSGAGSYSISDGMLHINLKTNTGSEKALTIRNKNVYPYSQIDSYIFEGYIKAYGTSYAETSWTESGLAVGQEDSEGLNWNDKYSVGWEGRNDRFALHSWIGSFQSIPLSVTNNTWYLYYLHIKSSSDADACIGDTCAASTWDIGASTNYRQILGGQGNAYVEYWIDWIRVRKYADPEPTVIV